MLEKKLAAVAVWMLLLAPSVPADVLVTRGGEHIETDGPWEVKKNQVIFTTPKGVLSSVRLSEIDLEASELATNPPEAATDEENAEETKTVLVLTNEDIPSAEEAEDARSEGEASARTGEDQEEPEDRCTPNLTLGNPVVSGRKAVFNGVVLSPQGCPRIGRIRWDWGDGTKGNSWFPAKHNYDEPGVYYLEVTARNLKGVTVTEEAVVKIPADGSGEE